MKSGGESFKKQSILRPVRCFPKIEDNGRDSDGGNDRVFLLSLAEGRALCIHCPDNVSTSGNVIFLS